MKNKLIKSFVLVEDHSPSSSGNIFHLKKGQGKIGISFKELVFENKENGHCLNMKWIEENNNKIKIKEKFNSVEEKFEFIL